MDFIFIFWKNQKYWFNVLLEEQLKRFGESSKCSNLKFSRKFGTVGMASSHCQLYCHDRVGSSTIFFVSLFLVLWCVCGCTSSDGINYLCA